MIDRPDKLNEVQSLTCAMLDEQIDDAGVRRLEGLLFGDPEACELYLNLTTLHAHLIREHGGAAAAVPPVPAAVTAASPRPSPGPVAAVGLAAPPPRRRGFRLAAIPWRRYARFAAAASVLLVVGVAGVSAWRASYQDPPGACATLIDARDVAWAECGPPHVVGDRVVPSTVGLTRGTIVLRFDGGAVATLTAPAELQVETRKSAELRRGSVLVRSDRESTGFTLRTTASDYVDLGTEFGVAVNEDATSEVHVFEGVVIARPRASDQVVPVVRNEAGRVEVDRGDLVAIEANAGRFAGLTTVAMTGRPDAAGAVAAVPLALGPGGPRASRGGPPAGTRPPPWAAAVRGPSDPASPGSAVCPPIRTLGPLPADARVVFLGDRATDYETHLLLIDQALARSTGSGDHPRLYNAGRTLPLAFAEAEFRRFVLTFSPTHAVLEFGPELAAGPHRVSAGQFEADLRRLIDRLETDGVEPILSTGFRLGERQAPCQGVLDEYNAAVRRIAAEHGYRLADVDARFRSPETYKMSLVAPNGAVPTFSGYQQIAAALLAAMGYPGAKIDPSLRLALLPGVVTQWRYRLKPAAETVDDARASVLTSAAWPLGDGAGVGEGWQDLVLPQADDKLLSRLPKTWHSPTFRDRERGFATDLCRPREQTLEAVALVNSPESKPAYLNTGAGVRAAWVNGEKVFDSQGRWTGWHAGKERVPVRLVAGPNRLVIESGGCFFVSITDEYDWPVQ